MAYTRTPAPQGQSNTRPAAAQQARPAVAAKPVPARAAPVQTATGTGGKRPDYEIVRVDAEGNIVKVEKEIKGELKLVSDRLAAVWKSKFEDGALMVKFEDGTQAKMFTTTRPQG